MADRRPLLPNLMLAAASAGGTLLLIFAAEGVLRWSRPAFLRHTRVDHPHVHSEVYGWELRRNHRYEGKNGSVVTVNGRGYRGPAVPRSGGTRIVLLGDSVTFGSGVSDAETFAARLGAMDPRLEVVNLAVNGYGTDQAVLRLEREGLAEAPAAVVLNFCLGNDYFDNALPTALYDGTSPKPYFRVEGGDLRLHADHLRLGTRRRAAVFFRERSHLVNALLLLGPWEAAPGTAEEESPHWLDRTKAVLKNFPAAADLTLRLVGRAAAACRSRGVAFAVVLHPDRRTFGGDLTLVRPFEHSPHVAGLTIVDARTRYLGMGVRFDDITLDKLGHLNPRGHTLAAEVTRDVVDSITAKRR